MIEIILIVGTFIVAFGSVLLVHYVNHNEKRMGDVVDINNRKPKDKDEGAVGEVKRIMAENEASEVDPVEVVNAIKRLAYRLNFNKDQIDGVKQFQLKYDTIIALVPLLEESISTVLNDAAHDLAYLHSLTKVPPSDGDRS